MKTIQFLLMVMVMFLAIGWGWEEREYYDDPECDFDLMIEQCETYIADEYGLTFSDL